MIETETTAHLLQRFGAAIARRDWPGLGAVLAPGFTATLLHTGERFDAEGFVAFNSGYPGAWVFEVDEIVDGGERAVLRSRTTLGEAVYHCASFATSSAGRLTELVEVWTEAVAPHPERG